MTPRELADKLEAWIVDNLAADEARCTIVIADGKAHLEHFERKSIEVALPPLIRLPTGEV